MVRRCAAFVLGLALIAAIGFAMSHAHPLKAPGTSIGFSVPCEPATPAFQAASDTNVVSTTLWSVAPVRSAAVSEVWPAGWVEAISTSVAVPSPAVYPPLLRRPPPVNS